MAADISIHALREEGDSLRGHAKWEKPEFLSTPSARRATRQGSRRIHRAGISIHALREEGDGYTYTVGDGLGISIHALREEGDTSSIEWRARWPISIHALREEGDS